MLVPFAFHTPHLRIAQDLQGPVEAFSKEAAASFAAGQGYSGDNSSKMKIETGDCRAELDLTH